MKLHKLIFPQITLIVFINIFSSFNISAQNGNFPFDSENWQLFNGQFVEYMGRTTLMGSAQLIDVEFENGIIEYDIAVTGERSYPGIRFRVQSMADAENFYIRPHIIGVSQDALQYTPIFNNEACWQLYNGEGFTSGINMQKNEWVRVRMEVTGSQARVYIGDVESPSLKINYLKHGKSKGGIVLVSPPNGSAYFSNFRINKTTNLNFEPPLNKEMPPGIITDWQISQTFKYSKIDLEKTYNQQNLTDLEWQTVNCEKSGLVNVSSYIQRRGREPDFIFAKTIIESDEDQLKQLNFGYSDWVVIFLNEELLFSGSSPYQGRGMGFYVSVWEGGLLS
ncbi:hypothetical protein ACFLS9_01500 [Bacteroidota bacterium]